MEEPAFAVANQSVGGVASERRFLENEVRANLRFGEIVGNSVALTRVLERAAIVAQTDSTVLITGETGTGKESLARGIHEMSPRRGYPFVKLNCAAIPTGLLESELFGHEKGAFTGAVTTKMGRLEAADRATLFLDEVGDIPLELQPKLLRVLQDHEFERLGGTRTIRVDVRLIAATNRDLARAVAEKRFRSDLFYRLHVFPLHVPALRERREDIPLLVRYFVQRASTRLNKHIDFVPDEAIATMLQWGWPGNIRELENFIQRSVILSEGSELRPPVIRVAARDAATAIQRRCHPAGKRKTTYHRRASPDPRSPLRSRRSGSQAGTETHYAAIQDAETRNLAHRLPRLAPPNQRHERRSTVTMARSAMPFPP
jgi:formate hydrogenlyase transcriptional activator